MINSRRDCAVYINFHPFFGRSNARTRFANSGVERVSVPGLS